MTGDRRAVTGTDVTATGDVMKVSLRTAVQLALIAALYFAAAKLVLALAIPPGYATAVWPSSGIALAALLLLGRQFWPGVWVGAALANFTIQYSAPLAAAIATGNTLEALAAAALVRRFIGVPTRFEHGEHVVRFVAAVMAGCAVAPTAAALALGALSAAPSRLLLENWWTWWQGDAAGMIIVAPLLMSWSRAWPLAWTRGRVLECACYAALLVVTTLAVFGDWFTGDNAFQFSFMLLPFIIWAAFRFTQREVATASAVVCGIAVWYTVVGSGPFATGNLNQSLLVLQAFVATVAVTGLALAAVLEERRRAEEALHLANEELERFVYVAAHDLQEPVRTVINFSDLLDRRIRGTLDGETRTYLDFVTAGAQRTRRILADLLAFSQIAHQPPGRPGKVDCDGVLLDALENLRSRLDEAGAVVTREPLPTVTGDSTHLQLLFQNLIGNAVKFRGAEAPRIHVSARAADGGWVFAVRDNGIGIDPAHFGSIFGMFQRLHSADRYPGTGIGLTICRKIIERHDGRIWVESAPGKGATFYFMIPER